MQPGSSIPDTNAPLAKSASASAVVRELAAFERGLVLSTAFLAWMFAGLEISLFVLLTRPAMFDLLGLADNPANAEAIAGQWFAWFQCAFLLGAAAGGWLFGWLGDRVGRTRSMAASVLCYSLLTGLSYGISDPRLMLILRFLACLGVGGVWPNAVSLTGEALPKLSRPLLAGLMGAAANVGFVLLGLIAYQTPITPDTWRWVLLVGGAPALLGVFILLFVPESPRWLADRDIRGSKKPPQPLREIMQPPLLKRTVIGICLGAIPVIGTSANANWLIPWADQASSQRTVVEVDKPATSAPVPPASPKPRSDPRLKAWTQVTRSGGAIVGSLLGGWLASLLGRRTAYFFISLIAFGLSTYIYGVLDPLHPLFSRFTFLLGFVGVTYFGWLPLYLPELFPTRVRSTGTGVTFNSGRILAAVSVLAAGVLMRWFDGDYARVGTVTGLIYVVGMLVVCFAPDTTRQPAEVE